MRNNFPVVKIICLNSFEFQDYSQAPAVFKKWFDAFREKFGSEFFLKIHSLPILPCSVVFSEEDVRNYTSTVSLAELITPIPQDPRYSGFVAEQVYDGLIDPEVDIIWFYHGGVPTQNPERIEKQKVNMEMIIEKLRAKLDNFPWFHIFKPYPVQKLMIGYCYATPILFYSAARGLTRSVHAPLAHEVVSLSDHEAIRRMKDLMCNHNALITAPPPPLVESYNSSADKAISFPPLTALNDAGRSLKARLLESSLTGTVFGGLLNSVVKMLKMAVDNDESKKGYLVRVVKGKPLFLFLEMLDTGVEENAVDELYDLIIKEKIVLQGIAFGWQRAEPYRQVIFKDYYTRKFQNSSVPVFGDLSVGHKPANGNWPVPFGLAKFNIDRQTQLFQVTYFRRPFGDKYRYACWRDDEVNGLLGDCLPPCEPNWTVNCVIS